MRIRNIAVLLAISSGELACSTKVVDLDLTTFKAGTEPDVLAIVHERLEKIAVDDQRLYWIGTRMLAFSDKNPWFLRSCQKRDCESTLVTYDSGLPDIRREFSVSDGQIFWYRGDPGGLFSCAVAGCSGRPSQLAAIQPLDAAAFSDGYLYHSDESALSRLSLQQPEQQELIANTPGLVLGIATYGAYVYWVAEDPLLGNKNSILRARTDGSSDIETIAANIDISIHREFRVAMDEASLYWTTNLLSGAINRCPLAGCTDAPEVLLAPLSAPQNLLIDDTRLYYLYETEPYKYAVSSCNLPDCVTSPPLLQHLDAPSGIAQDDRYLYVATTEQDVSPSNDKQEIVARIRRLPKPAQESP